MRRFITLILLIFLVLLVGCKKEPLGSKKNPIKMFFVPSLEQGKLMTSGKVIEEELEKLTGLEIETKVPQSYAAVVEALGVEGRCDVAWIPTYAYYLAHKKYNAEVKFQIVRNGLRKYRGQFIALSSSGIESVEDIEGKIIGYTDASSTSGFIFPSALLASKGIIPAKKTFTGGHDTSVRAVLQGQVDVGCTYWSPANENGIPQDARLKLLTEEPDIFKKVKTIGFTDWIPNDTCTFGRFIPKDIADKLSKGIEEFAKSEKGKKVLYDLYQVDDLIKVDNTAYEEVFNTLDSFDFKQIKF